LNLRLPRKLKPLVAKQKRFKIVIGGRGSAKSTSLADIFLLKIISENADILCLRELQNSIDDSVHKLFRDRIENHQLGDQFTVTDKKIELTSTGKGTRYKGAARNSSAIKSAEGFKYSWFEEAQNISEQTLKDLLPTIRAKGSELWFSANPQSSADPFSQRFINPYKEHLDRDGYYEDDLHLIIVINYEDNPWFPAELDQQRLWDYENLDRALYNHIWLGHFNDSVDNAIIKAEWFDACLDAHKTDKLKAVFKPHGATIVAHDPSDGGADAKGIAARFGSIITHVDQMTTGEIDQGCDWATGLARQWGADWFVWDGDGMGAGLKRQVETAFASTKIKHSMFRGSLSGSGMDGADKVYLSSELDKEGNPKTIAETFKNNRARYYLDLSRRMYNTYRVVTRGEYVDPDDMISLDTDGIANIEALRSELCRIPRRPNPNGLEQIMSKQEMAKLGLKSPNMADSVMMTMWQPPIKTERKPLKYQKVSIA
jgi:phage terminase large subunit